MLIGTWNVQGRWSPAHRDLLERQACEVWLLTEVNDDLALPGFHAYRLANLPAGRLVWGGDWNHALEGREYSGSPGGRASIAAMLDRRRLQAPTSTLPHQIDELLSINHISVGRDALVTSAERFTTAGLSDHDGCVVEANRPAR